MPTALLLAARCETPAADAAVALAAHVWTRWCPRSRYTLQARWDGPPAYQRQLTERTDLEPLGETLRRAVDAGADRVLVGGLNISARMPWLVELRRVLATTNLERVEVRWERGGLRKGEQVLPSWCGVALLHTGTTPLVKAFEPEFDLASYAAEAMTELGGLGRGDPMEAHVLWEPPGPAREWLLTPGR